jgi:hypothetical protein
MCLAFIEQKMENLLMQQPLSCLKSFPQIRVRGFACTIFLLVLNGCFSPSPPNHPLSLYGQGYYAHVVKALDAYYRVNGTYPNKLQELVPKWLVKIPELPREHSSKYIGFLYNYREKTGEYILRFEFQDGSLDYCTYSSRARRWECEGLY